MSSAAGTSDFFETVNPATAEVLKRYRVDTTNEVDQKLSDSRVNHDILKKIRVDEKISFLQGLEKELHVHQDTLAQSLTQEMGKPILQAFAEVRKSQSLCRFLAENAIEMTGEQLRFREPGIEARVLKKSLGPILAIMPWNFPYWQSLRAVLPALISGNTVLLKSAPNTTGSGLLLCELINRVSQKTLKSKVVSPLLTQPTDTLRIIGDARVRGVSFTGSTRAGRAIAEHAGRALKPCLLELGGSDPYLVFADAHLDQAAECALTARMINGGQSCIAAKRWIVHQHIADRFMELVLDKAKKYVPSNPQSPDCQLGPMARLDLQQEIHRQALALHQEGAVRICGAELPAGKGFFYPFTLFDHVEAHMIAYREECFGPLASITRFENTTQAITLANHSSYGLGAAVFTQDSNLVAQCAQTLDCGMISINDFVRSDPRLPFGGVKDSGFGRELGIEACDAFSNLQSIFIRSV